jgi:hypothetical protein
VLSTNHFTQFGPTVPQLRKLQVLGARLLISSYKEEGILSCFPSLESTNASILTKNLGLTQTGQMSFDSEFTSSTDRLNA